MEARHSYRTNQSDKIFQSSYLKNLKFSVQTSASDSPRQSLEHQVKISAFFNKEKSQLCKKFIQHGNCPYQTKCKFAHGCHQLKRNQQTNSKYKTKQCGVYINQGYCPYGERCNFIHKKVRIQHDMETIDEQFIAIRIMGISQSRLQRILR